MAWFKQEEQPKPQKSQEEFEIDLAKKVTESVASALPQTVGEVVKQYFEQDPTLTELRQTMAASRERQLEQQRRQSEQTSQTEQQRLAEARENMDDHTRTYVDRQFEVLNRTAQQTSARELRRSIFEDAENYEYYTGDVKRKVDEMLDREPLQAQNTPDVIRNAYKVVVFEHMKDIQDKKLRSRLSSVSAPVSTPGQSQVDPNALPELTDEEKLYAGKMGIKLEDWAKSKKEYAEEVSIRV